MKTPDEIKTGLEVCASGAEFGCIDRFCPYGYLEDEGECCDSVLCNDALAYIHQLEDMLKDSAEHAELIMKENAELDNVRLAFAKQTREAAEYKAELLNKVKETIEHLPTWFSVNERLPEDGVDVIVYTDRNGGNVEFAYYRYSRDAWFAKSILLVPNVLYWMPLPEPPTEV